MLLVWMSIAGTIPLIIFIVFWFVQRNSFNYLLGKILLYLSMIFYLIPFQLIAGILPEHIYDKAIVGAINSLRTPQSHFEYSDSSYVSINDGIMWTPRWIAYILCIWFIIVFIFAIYQIIKYRRYITHLLKISEERMYNFDNVGTVRVLINNNIRTPYTVGFLRPRIIFHEDIIESKHNSAIYKHEYCHAKNHDALVELICLIIICIHWFNPIAILLLFSYSNLCEYVCDDYATEGLSYNERKEFANLLLDLSSPKTMPVVWRNHFVSAKYLLKRRLTYIMKKKFGRIQKLVTVIISVVTVVTSSLTVFAYEPLQSSTEDVVAELEDGDFMDFCYDEDYVENDIIDEINFYGHEDVFITNDGETIIIENINSNEYAICNHTFASGKVSKHISDGNGGCTVKLYNAQRCTKCYYIVLGSLIKTTTYVTCPH